MTRWLIPLATAIALTGCGEVDESVNPSDVARTGTGLAVLNSAGDPLEDLAPEFALTSTDDDCSGALQVEGAIERTFEAPVDCPGSVARSRRDVGWAFEPDGLFILGVDASRLDGASPRVVHADADIVLPVDGVDTAWEASCRLDLRPVEDGAWSGTARCAESDDGERLDREHPESSPVGPIRIPQFTVVIDTSPG